MTRVITMLHHIQQGEAAWHKAERIELGLLSAKHD